MEVVNNFFRRNWRTAFIFITVAVDTFAAALSFELAYFIRQVLPWTKKFELSSLQWIILYFWAVPVVCGLILGLYRASFHTNSLQQYRLAGKSYLFSAAIVVVSFYAFEANALRAITFLYFLILPFFFVVGRIGLNRFNAFMQRKGLGVHNAIIVGYEDGGEEVFERFRGFPELGYVVKGFVSKTEDSRIVKKTVPHYHVSQLGELVQTQRIDRAFIPSPKFITNGYSELVDVCKKERIKLKVLSPEADRLLQMARIYDIAGISLYSPTRKRIDFVRRTKKRAFDVCGALVLIFLLSPVFILAACAIFFESGGPIFFKQRRSSLKHGKKFHFYKFRSMVRNADELKDDLYKSNEADGALFKIKNDPRKTRVGRILRKFSIDELPQLLNVLRGDMSLVGPRPLPVADFEKVKEDSQFWDAIKDRDKMKPGMTGLWQISGRSNIGFREMVLLDLYYIENQSMLFDLEILFATIPVVLFGKGAY